VGAHVGAVAVSMAKQIASVTAFEANPDTFKLLSCNKILNGLDNLEIHNLAASDKTERLRFVLNRHNSGGSKRYPIQPHPAYFHDNPKVVEVDAVALDQFLPNKTYSLVFMDIEGSEYFALKGMSTLLSRTKTLFVEFIPHHLQNVAAISPEEFGATLEPYFEYLYVPGLNSYVDRRNFGVLLRRMYDINLAQEQIVFTNSQGLSVIQTEIRRFTK
jgi:FkbM family methyltransferase